MITGKNYIGHQLSAKGKAAFNSYNPQNNAANEWSFIEATEEEIEEAVSLANKAFEQMSNVSGFERAEFLEQIAVELMNIGEQLLNVFVQETGYTMDRAVAERTRTINQIRQFSKYIRNGDWQEISIDTGDANTAPLPKPDIRKMLYAIGPVVVFGAGNFPLAFSTAGGDVVSALAAGCPVIVKGHPKHPGIGELVAHCIIKAAQQTNMPDGIFSNINGAGNGCGEFLVKHPLVKAVGFTGSAKGGKSLLQCIHSRKEPIPFFAEMGSLNPVIILPEALSSDAGFWADKLAGSITLGGGQFCTKPGLLIGVESPELDDFIVQLQRTISGIAPAVMIAREIKENYLHLVKKITGVQGVKLFQQEVAPENRAAHHVPHTIAVVAANVFTNEALLQEEVFGPFAVVVKCANKEEVLKLINGLSGQLTATIAGTKKELTDAFFLFQVLRQKAGRIIFNNVPTGVEVCSSMVHGGPYPASSDSRYTAVGIDAIKRWLRPVCFQNFPDELLPMALKENNPFGIVRRVNSELVNPIIHEREDFFLH